MGDAEGWDRREACAALARCGHCCSPRGLGGGRAAKKDAPRLGPRGGRLAPRCRCLALPSLTARVLSGCRHYPSKAGHGLMDTWYDSPVPSYSPTSRMVPREFGKSFQTGKRWPLPSRAGSLGWPRVVGEGSCGPGSSTEVMLSWR